MKNKTIFFLADAKSIHTVKWVDYFVQKDYKVYLATFANINNTKCKNIYFLTKNKSSVRGGNYHYLLFVSKLAKILKEIKPDFINAHYSYSMGLIAYLAIQKSKIKTNFSVVCHGSDILDTPAPFIFNKVNQFILKKADNVFVVSDQIKDKLVDWKISEEKIFVGQYGIDLIEQNDITKDIDILSNRTYCDNSNIEFLLESLMPFKGRDLNIVFILPTVSDEDFNRLKERYSFIKFYKYVEYNEMIKMLNRTKIYISATKSDGTSLSLLEAMGSGCVPLVSNIVSNRSWILDTVNGYLFNNKRDFQYKLQTILDDKGMFLEMLNINIQLIRKRANYNTQMKKIEESIK